MSKYNAQSQTNSEDLNKGMKEINWDDYNYPICLKIFHYDPQETERFKPDISKKVLLLKINHILIIVACIWNFFNNIVNTSQGVEGGAIRIALSLVLIFTWLPVSFYLFVIPYKNYMGKQEKVFIFYIMSFLCIIWYFIWSIADFADCNGWIMVQKNSAANRGGATFFSVLTAIMMFAISIIGGINLFFFCRRSNK